MSKLYRTETETKQKDNIDYILSVLPDYITSYINHIQFTTTPLTRLGYLRDILLFMEYVLDAAPNNYTNLREIELSCLESLSLDFINSYLGYLSHYEKNGKLYTNNRDSIRRKLSALRNLYAFLFANDYIHTNILPKVKIPKSEKKEIIRLDHNESKELLNTVEKGRGKMTDKQLDYYKKYALRDIAIINILIGTGIRVSELVGLDISDINEEHFSLKVIRKGNKEDIVFYSDDIADIISDYLVYRKTLMPAEESKNALFLSSRMSRISVRAVELLVKKYSQRANIIQYEKITPHKLRATYGTNLYESTGDLYLVADVLGHSSVETTRKHYAELTSKRKFTNRNAVDYHQ